MNSKPLKVNHLITAKELRVLDEAGENIGVLSKGDALRLAGEKELDLIEVGPNSDPPIARLMDYDKYRYDEKKKQKGKRASQKQLDQKQVQISARAAKNDLDLKARKADAFLNAGHPVVIVMKLRGREKGNKDWAKEKLAEFLKMITVEFKTISEPKWGGRGLMLRITKQ